VRGSARLQPRTRPPAERRAQLMNAAERLFLKQGVARTTVEDITAGAGVARGTFYLYFSSKEDLRAALGERFGDEHLAHVKAAIEKLPPQDWHGRLSAWSRASLSFYLNSIRLHDVLFYEGRAPTREGLTRNVVIDHLAELLRLGHAARAWSVDEPRVSAVFLFSGIHSVVDDAYCRHRRVNRARLMKIVERLCSGTVVPPRT
jgi:AcrR family transcriptional regulator